MRKLAYRLISGAAWLALSFNVASAHAKPHTCSLVEGKAQTRLDQEAESIRRDDNFFRQLVLWKGEPFGCRGRVSEDPTSDEYWIEFSWPDGSKFESGFMQPEISVIRYSRADGLTQPDDVIALVRKSAAEFGLNINWATPDAMKKGDSEVIEYRDPLQGINGIVRYTYDRQHRLVGATVSMAP